MTIFDAQAARALARRTLSLGDCLAAMKRAVLHAAQVGEFEATIGLPDALPVADGQSTNTAAFLIDFFSQQGVDAWADAVRHAERAGYAVRPAWRSAETGAAIEGLILSWYLVEVPEFANEAPPLLMPATLACAMSQAEQGHHRWVEALREPIRKAALHGKPSVSVHDGAIATDPAWAKRREILKRAGFNTELLAGDRGATLLIAW